MKIKQNEFYLQVIIDNPENGDGGDVHLQIEGTWGEKEYKIYKFVYRDSESLPSFHIRKEIHPIFNITRSWIEFPTYDREIEIDSFDSKEIERIMEEVRDEVYDVAYPDDKNKKRLDVSYFI